MGLPTWLSGKESACQVGDVCSTLGGEDPLEEKMTTHSVFLPEKFDGWGAWSLMGSCKESETTEQLNSSGCIEYSSCATQEALVDSFYM